MRKIFEFIILNKQIKGLMLQYIRRIKLHRPKLWATIKMAPHTYVSSAI